LYGDKFTLALTPAKGGGLEACIDIPYHTDAWTPNATSQE
jgi:hypothetical protein